MDEDIPVEVRVGGFALVIVIGVGSFVLTAVAGVWFSSISSAAWRRLDNGSDVRPWGIPRSAVKISIVTGVLPRSSLVDFDMVASDAFGLLSVPGAVDDVSGTLMETDGLAGAIVGCPVFEVLVFWAALLPKSYALTFGAIGAPVLYRCLSSDTRALAGGAIVVACDTLL